MGSPDRFTFDKTNGFGLGVFYSKFPYRHYISINILFWHIGIGIGKAYDE